MPKKNVFVLLLFLPISLVAQNFEGIIEYEVKLFSKDPDTRLAELDRWTGNNHQLYIKGDYIKYVKKRGLEIVETQVLSPEDGRMYRWFEFDPEVVFWSDPYIENSKIVYHNVVSNKTTILGKQCHLIQARATKASIEFYYTDELKMNTFWCSTNAPFSSTNDLITLAGDFVPLKYVIDHEKYQVIIEAKSIKNVKLDDFHFSLTSLHPFMVPDGDLLDAMPEPLGGMNKFYEQVGNDVRYPKKAAKHTIGGQVMVQFIVSKEGKVSRTHVVNGIGYGCDKEAERVIKESNLQWKPALVDGKPVDFAMIVPIKFKAL
ncbi:energy transducer TonB [Fulvivirgaceae bacterium BMA10]|uniref:Energy transducer TonB n=1 Tax=Splendidivirga corallicola TaxID=3051826 RepID=A0ABT8KHX1_9BACT|nr:energy transducer TonB [Fulvivirgaceae bacterium BMA10]